eukprot:CAMPEP_0184012386 /NCGR_PEP_ID=MMETSP0954-20121128/4377_1 /TAXON_ID=627963 /ORGANISM="Aplanochytrium sp, Strain PBS07" /LENGTH=290 /DNA_ID=CAMNT_0026292355 /DNA_START=27 /DNA_END=899 /DNA_ORIENTATION=+
MDSVFKKDVMKGKVVLVTGGGTGIGFGICTTFGRHGAKIAMGGRRSEVLEEACEKLSREGIDAIGIPMDVRDPSSCENIVTKTVEKFGRIDILVNNAAGNFMVAAESLSSNGFKTVMDIDLHGSFNMSKAVLPVFKQAEQGVIINISATLHYRATPFQMHASAAKAGIDVMTRVMGVEWAEYGIRCVSIAPGPIEGTVGGPNGRVFGQKKGNHTSNIVPVGRFGTVWDIGNTALFLASEAGSFITATEVVVDGGHYQDGTGSFRRMKAAIEAKSHEEKSGKTYKTYRSKI